MKLISLIIISVGLVSATIPPIDQQWGQWGLAGIVIGFVMYRDYRREDKLSDRLGKQEDWIKKELAETINKNTIVIERLCNRPCMLENKND